MKHSRRPHSKSRNGCLACKSRKIKCDEQKPKCSGCLRRDVDCISPRDSALARLRTRPSPSSQASSLTPVGYGWPGELEFTLTDFGLYHHFLMHTSKTFIEEALRTGDLWMDVVPSMASSHVFLMRGILAIAAFHTAFLNPREQKKYVLIASQHQGLALRAYQETLANMNDDNCHAIFAFSTLIITSYFASNTSEDTTLLLFSNTEQGGQGVAEWIKLVRGVTKLFAPIMPIIFQGPMGPLVAIAAEPSTTFENPDDRHIMAIHELLTSPAVTMNNSSDEIQACKDATEQLREAIAQSHFNQHGTAVTRRAYTFLAQVSDEFIRLFGESRPPALVIMAHYCVLLNMARHAWFMTGKAAQMLRVIQGRLSAEWQKYLEWPLSQMDDQSASESPY